MLEREEGAVMEQGKARQGKAVRLRLAGWLAGISISMFQQAQAQPTSHTEPHHTLLRETGRAA